MLQDIECPTLVLQTQNQTLREDTAASVLASGIRDARLVATPGGRMLPLFEAEEPLIKALSDFLG